MNALDRLRRKNAESMVMLLARSADPVATLRHHQRQIRNAVINALIEVSYQQAEDGELGKALSWAELAEEASLLAGTVQNQADVWLCRATVLWHVAEALPKEKDRFEMLTDPNWHEGDPDILKPGPQALDHLKDALEWADRALAACEQAGLCSLVPHVRHRQATIHASAGDRVAALRDQIEVVNAWAGVPGSPDPPAADLGNVAARYWNLRTRELRAGAEALESHAAALLAVAALWPPGPELTDLREALGDACEQVGDVPGALDHWEHAASAHQQAGAKGDEYRIRRWMQHLAYRAGAYQQALAYGHVCSEVARVAGVAASVFGNCLHNLAATHRELGDRQAAIATYREAAGLLEDEPGSTDRISCFLELGLLEVEHTLFENARRDLEQVLASPGTEIHYWIADTALAEICLNHLGDLDTAIRHAENALDESTSPYSAVSSPVARLYALHLSGMANAAAGKHDIAISRFEQAIQIGPAAAERRHSSLIVSPYYRHEVIPPTVTSVTALALQACQAAGRTGDAQHYLNLHLRAMVQEAGAEPPEPTGDQAFDEAFRAFQAGLRLEHTDPAQAAHELQRVVHLLNDAEDTSLLVTVHAIAGRCLLKTADYDAARAHFEKALALTGTDADLAMKLTCAEGLAMVWLQEGDLVEAYQHLSSYVELTERYRSSLPTAEERIRFMRGNHLAIYTVLISACVLLGRTSEALETLELIKSRTLADMLTQATRRPVDYTLTAEASRLRDEREKLLGEFGQQFFKYDENDLADLEKSVPYRLLTMRVGLRKQQAEIHQRARARNVLERIDATQERMKTADIRSLLHP